LFELGVKLRASVLLCEMTSVGRFNSRITFAMVNVLARTSDAEQGLMAISRFDRFDQLGDGWP